MKEMLTKISWDSVKLSETASQILGLKPYVNCGINFGVSVRHCMDEKVIALAKEMKKDFLGKDNYEGFRIIAWDETKVVPVFIEHEYGDEDLLFVSREAVDNDDLKFDGDDELELGEYIYAWEKSYIESTNYIDYEPIEVMVVRY